MDSKCLIQIICIIFIDQSAGLFEQENTPSFSEVSIHIEAAKYGPDKSVTAVSTEVVQPIIVEKEKPCIVVQDAVCEGKFKSKRRKITHDLVLEQQFNTLLLKQENLRLQKRKLELEVSLMEERVKGDSVIGRNIHPLTTINVSPILTSQNFE